MTEATEVGVASGPAEPGKPAPPRFRVLKIPRKGSDGSQYTVLMPGSLPGGLHLSVHPSGDLHLRAVTAKGVVTLDLVEVARRVATVGPGPLLRLMMRPPTPGHKAVGMIVPGPAALPSRTGVNVDLDASKMVDSMVGFEVEDTSELVEILNRLRKDGVLHDEDTVQITVPDTDETSFFRPFSGQMVPVPDEMPFAKDVRALQRAVSEAGGIFQTVGGPAEFFERMRGIPGFDLIMDFVTAVAEGLDEPGHEAKVMAQLMPFLGGMEPAIQSACRRGVLPAVREDKAPPP